MTATDRSKDAHGQIGPRQRYALILLTAIYGCHSLDRAVVSVVIEPLKRELKLSDTSVGIVTGLGYGLAFGLAAVPIGVLVDRVNRVRLMTLLVLIWSLLTGMAGIAHSFTTILIARMGVGAAEAGGQPTALSILADLIPEERRSSALGIFYLGTAIGFGLSFLVGGIVAAHYGWRAAFFLAGAPGLILALLFYVTVSEPDRGGQSGSTSDPAPPFFVTIGHLARLASIRHMFAGMLLTSFSMSVLLVWMVPLLMRIHRLALAQAGIVGAVTTGICTAVGAIVAGNIADRLARRGNYRRAWVPASAAALSVPLAIGAALASSAQVAIACILGFGVFASAWTAPGYTAMLAEVPSRMRGTMLGMMQVGATLLGAAMSPFLTGVLSDQIGGPNSLAYAIAILSLVGLWASVHFLVAARAIRRREATPASVETAFGTDWAKSG